MSRRRGTTVSSLRRLGQLVAVLARHALSSVLGTWVARWPRLARHLPPTSMGEPERLRLILEELGGIFIKLGQMLALQADILPDAYCRALYDLLDRVPPVPYAEVEELFLRELGRPPAEIFEHFECRPLASASIGQVHVAELDGSKWAVKVQRPDAEAQFAADMRLMRAAVVLIRRLRLRRLAWVADHLEEFVEWTAQELDYRAEAARLVELRRDGRDNPWQQAPRVLGALTTRRVLVMEFLEGVTALEFLRARESGDQVGQRRLAAAGFDSDRFAAHVVDNFLQQVFVHGFFHADLHPANLMILPGDAVGYLDLGIVGRLSPFARRKLVDMTLAYTRGEVGRMCDAFFDLAVVPHAAAGAAFQRGFLQRGEGWYERRRGELRLARSFTAVLLDMLHLSRVTGVWPERSVLKYIRSLMAIDGLMQRSASRLDVGTYLEAACRRLLREHGAAAAQQRLVQAAGRLAASASQTVDAMEQLARGELGLRGRLHWPPARQPSLTTWWPVAAALALVLLEPAPGLAAESETSRMLLTSVLPPALLGAWLGTLWNHRRTPDAKETLQ